MRSLTIPLAVAVASFALLSGRPAFAWKQSCVTICGCPSFVTTGCSAAGATPDGHTSHVYASATARGCENSCGGANVSFQTNFTQCAPPCRILCHTVFVCERADYNVCSCRHVTMPPYPAGTAKTGGCVKITYGCGCCAAHCIHFLCPTNCHAGHYSYSTCSVVPPPCNTLNCFPITLRHCACSYPVKWNVVARATAKVTGMSTANANAEGDVSFGAIL